MHMRLTAALLLFLIGLARLADAQSGGSSDVVAWTVRAVGAQRGHEARVVFRAEIEPGWRMYALNSPGGLPLGLNLDGLPDTLVPRSLRQSVPQEMVDEATGAPYTYHATSARLEQRLRVANNAPRGTHVVAGSVRYAVCNDTICLAPATAPFRTTIVVR